MKFSDAFNVFNNRCKIIKYTIFANIFKGSKRQHYIEKIESIEYRCLTNEQIEKNISSLKAKINKKVMSGGGKKTKIRVYFAAWEKAQWGLQSVYDAMKKDSRFEPKILVINAWQRQKTQQNSDLDLINFFKSRNMDVITELNNKNLPDILFLASVNLNSSGINYPIYKLYKKVLLCYFSYAWVIEANVDNAYYNSDNVRFFWKEFVPDKRSYDAAQNNPVNGKNVVLSGHPKTDELHNASAMCPVWKNQNNKKIIYAPHWSLYNAPSAMGNFLKYYHDLLEYIKKHPEIDMVLKPHPFLRGFIADKEKQKFWYNTNLDFTIEDYNSFLKEWESLPNASIMDSGDYYNLFKSSDAMILDSMSFIAEYSVINKPMCFLSRENNESEFMSKFNSVARDILNVSTVAYNWSDIENFIDSVILKGNDTQKEKRTEVIKRHLEVNKGHVGEFIKDNIKNELIS